MTWVRLALGGAAIAAAMMTGCTASHGQGPEACGPTVCAEGTVCCNASCGICVAPGGSCPAIGCAHIDTDAGPPAVEDAGITCGAETCGAGSHCCSGCTAAESYCAPLGEPCARPGCFPDAGTGRACEGVAGVDCGPDEFCDHSGICGPGDGGGTGTCQPRPDSCPEPGCRPVCGCDGNTYCSECDANLAGTTVASEGACGGGECEPMDARGEGTCFLFLGFAWNGTECVSVTGCSCEGADCEALFSSSEACVEAYSSCAADDSDCRTEGCPEGSSCQLCWAAYACVPDGAVC